MSEKILGNDIRVKNVLVFKGRLFSVLKREHIKPGKGGAFINVEMKSLDGATKINHRFRSDETLLRAFIEEEEYQYLFHDNKSVTLMSTIDYSQVSVDIKIFEDKAKLLQEEMKLKLQKHEEDFIGAILPETVKMTVEETEPYIKGQTAAASYKPATLNKGILRVMVPPFVKTGDCIVIKTDDLQYVGRSEDK